MSEATASAVIPNWNKASLLHEVLVNLQRQTYPLQQILVVDNGSTDGSVQIAEQAGATVLQLPRNLGFACAVNRGIEQCTSEWVLILNNDVTFGPEWLGTLMQSARAANAWFAVGKLRSAGEPNTVDGTFDAISRGAMPWRCGHGFSDGPLWSSARKITLAPMTAVLVRRELFNLVGLLDEQFESYLEDVDFGLRCAVKDYTGVYDPAAVGFHAGSATLGAWHKATVRRMARNQILLVRKHFHGAPLWPMMAGQLLWGLVALRNGAGLSWLRGKLDGLRLKPRRSDSGWPLIQAIVESSERDIWNLQKAAGFDLYWKLYFALVRN